MLPGSTGWPRLYAVFAFFLSAHRAFIIADNFFRMAALIGLRPARFLGAALVFFRADLPRHFAQRCFIAAEMRFRAAALMRRRFWRVAGAACLALGGRPRRAGETSPSSAETALSIRLRSVLSSESKLCMSTDVLLNDVVTTDCSRRVLFNVRRVPSNPFVLLPGGRPIMRLLARVRSEVESSSHTD